jgi:hypothetical protein
VRRPPPGWTVPRFFKSALFPLIVIVFAVFIAAQVLAACGSDDSAQGSGCVGEIVEKYNEYEPGLGITSGSVTIPTGKTKYFVVVEKADGTSCSKGMKKDQWIQTRVGDTYGTA